MGVNKKPPGEGQTTKDPFGLGGTMPAPTTSEQGQFLGVPDNYLAPPNINAFGPHYYPSGYNYTTHRYPGGPPSAYAPRQKPRYEQGDQYRPRNADPDSIWATQQALAAMGLMEGNFAKGVWDQNTADAWRKVLEYANQAGLTDEQAMVELGKASREGLYTVDEHGNVVPAGQGSPPPPLITHVTDPKIVKEAFRQGVIQATGEGWDDARLSHMAMIYNALERQQQEKEYNAQLTGKDAEIVDVPDPQSYIDAYVRDKDPSAVQEHDALTFASDAFQLLGSPAWGVG